MTLPLPHNDQEVRVIAAVFALFRRAGQWPAFEMLDRYLDSQGVPDGEELLLGMPAGLVAGVGPGSRPIRNDQEIQLTVAGLAVCDEAAEDTDLFMRLIEVAAKIESERPLDGPEPVLTADVASRSLPSPVAGQTDLLTRAGAVLAVESWGWTMYSPQAEERPWSFTFDRKVRRFRGLESLEDYWEIAHPEPPVPSGIRPSMVPAIRTGKRDHTWVTLLHPSIGMAAASRLEAGHDDNAVEEAWKVVASRLRELSGLDLDGVDLVNQELGAKGKLCFADMSSPQGRSEHEGLTNLLRGLAQAGRNVRAHRPSNGEAEETETAALLLVASLCMDRLDQLQPRHRRVSGEDAEAGRCESATPKNLGKMPSGSSTPPSGLESA